MKKLGIAILSFFICIALASVFSGKTLAVSECLSSCELPPDPPFSIIHNDPGQTGKDVQACLDRGCSFEEVKHIIEIGYQGDGGFTTTNNSDGSITYNCNNGSSITIKIILSCGAVCNTKTDCASAKPGCNNCVSNGKGINVCGPAACGTSCTTKAECASAKDGCNSCIGGSCKPAPACGADCSTNPTMCLDNPSGCNTCGTDKASGKQVCQPPVQCNADCTSDPGICATAVGGCTSCLTNPVGSGKSCQPAPACGTDCTKDPTTCSLAGPGCNTCIGTPGSAAKVCGTPACGTDCSTDASVCAKSGSCSQCVDEGNGVKQCAAPIACGTSCASNPGICKQASGGCNVCFQGACTQDKFNPGMCTCDGTDTNVQTTIQIENQDVTVTAYGKVSAANAAWAKIKDISFSLEKIGSTITEIAKSDPIPAVISQTTADKVQYKATWTIKLPSTVLPGESYQVTAASNCQRQILASMTLAKKPVKTVVLGIQTHILVLDHIIASVKQLFGMHDKTAVLAAQTELQIQSFRRVNVTKSCQSVNFQF